MTRFQISVITSKSIWTSIEFNGEGYWTGYGKEVFNTLKDEVKTVADWKKYVKEVNADYFNYKEKLHYCINGNEKENLLDMSSNYIDKWFSDYVYVKNISNEEVEFITEKGSTVLAPNEVAIFNFGTRIKPNDGGEWEVKTVYDLTREELDELKQAYTTQLAENEGEGISWEEWAYASNIPDDIIFHHYEGISFTEDDFFCNSENTNELHFACEDCEFDCMKNCKSIIDGSFYCKKENDFADFCTLCCETNNIKEDK